MTEQTTRNEWAAPERSPYRAAPDWYDTPPAEDHTAGAGAAAPEAADDSAIGEQPTDLSATEETGDDEAAAGVPHGVAEPAGVLDNGGVNTPDGGAPAPSANGRYGVEGPPAGPAPAGPQPPAAEPHDPETLAVGARGPGHNVEERAGIRAAEVPAGAASVADASGIGVAGSGELLPGDVAPEPAMALLEAPTAARFRDRWQQLQLRFIDDPHAVAVQAGALVDEVVTALHDGIDRRRSALEPEQSDDGLDVHAADTERLRVAVRHYRDFLDHLLGR